MGVEALVISPAARPTIDVRLPSEAIPRGAESAEKKFEPKAHEIAVIGVGAGSLGLMMHLDNKGQFDAALRRGMGFYDTKAFGAGTLNIDGPSNSDGDDFPAGIEAQAKVFGSVREGSAITGVKDYINLKGANEFYKAVGARLTEEIDQHDASDVVQRRVSYVQFNPNHTEPNERFTLFSFNGETGESEVVGYANKVVFGTGATQDFSPAHERPELRGKNFMTAEQLLSGDEGYKEELFARFASLPPEKRKLAFLGISHGSLAALSEILQYDDKRVSEGHDRVFGEGSITMFGRKEPHLYAKDRDEALEIAKELYGEQGESKIQEDMFAPNGAYKRLIGVRGVPRDTWRRVVSQDEATRETRVNVVIDETPGADIWENKELAPMDTIVQSFGPSVNLVPIYDMDGHVINKFDAGGKLVVGQNGNLETEAGEDIGAYGMGIGYSRRDKTEAMNQFAAPGEPAHAVTAANAYVTIFASDVVSRLGLAHAA